MSKKTPFLLEIGTEEIPARFFRTAIQDLQRHTADIFEKNRIAFSDVECLATPRRIMIRANILDPLQKSIISEVTGPPVKSAFDGNNNPTKAAEGFARSQGIKVSDLDRKKTDRGEYIVAVKEETGEKVSKVLPSVMPLIIRSLHFPKAMRWGTHAIRFARPIQWLLCLYGGSVVRFEIDGIKSAPYTRGHRLLANKKVRIQSPAVYEKELKSLSVIVDQIKRRDLIEKGIEQIAKKSSTRYIKDDELLNTVNFLVEYPYAVKCSFPEEYLALPDELLITVMKDHQKYFALTDKKGNLVNSFVVISNNNSSISTTVRAGAEKVIKARFEDARFYYNDDIKHSLRQRADQLKDITFHEKIGTIAEKVGRIRNIALEIRTETSPSLKDNISLAAELCKADLITGVVREFPELQGVIGYYYALHEKLAPEIAVAIKEHYKPLNARDTVPSTDEGKIISLADKIDSIVSFIAKDMVPTGSEDPYALRRQAQGIVQILLSTPYPLSINDLIACAASELNISNTEILSQMGTFIAQRIEFALSSLEYGDDVIKSVIHESLDRPLHVILEKVAAISAFKKSEQYSDFVFSMKRIRNILPVNPPSSIEKDLLKEKAELDLYASHEGMKEDIAKNIVSDNIKAALNTIVRITKPINAFFDEVLVMDKDERIKANRIALLQSIWNSAMIICDFSKLSET